MKFNDIYLDRPEIEIVLNYDFKTVEITLYEPIGETNFETESDYIQIPLKHLEFQLF